MFMIKITEKIEKGKINIKMTYHKEWKWRKKKNEQIERKMK